MQTIYYETSSFIRHQENVVDFAAYREKLEAVSGEHFSAQSAVSAPDSLPRAELVLVETRRPAEQRLQRRRRQAVAFWLEICASGAVLLFTIAAAVLFLRVF